MIKWIWAIAKVFLYSKTSISFDINWTGYDKRKDNSGNDRGTGNKAVDK